MGVGDVASLRHASVSRNKPSGGCPGRIAVQGYDDFVVKELVLRGRVMCYRRERWAVEIAPSAARLVRHFGP